MPQMTTISISKRTRDRLKVFGYKDETYDDIIKRLMKASEKELFHERQRRILETEEFTPAGKK